MADIKKKIALYHPWVYLKGGAERVILNIVTNSRHEWQIFTNHYDRENSFPEFSKLNIIESSRVPVERSYSAVSKSSLKIIRQKLDLDGFDALFVISEGVGDFITFRNHRIPTFCICLTPLKVIHDPFAKKRYLDTNKGSFLKYILASSIFKIIDKIVWKNYRYVICISEEVKRRVLKAKLAKEQNVEIVHPGVNIDKILPEWNHEQYFLIPGRIMWQKNIELGIKAFKRFSEIMGKNDFKLIISGIIDQKSKKYFKELQELSKDTETIQFISNPSDEKLYELYRNCLSVLFTSLNEDWGIVVLEAMAFGKPVISINRGGPTESIIHGETGFLLNENIEDFALHMVELAQSNEMVHKMGQAARHNVEKFTLSNFINKLDIIIDKNV